MTKRKYTKQRRCRTCGKCMDRSRYFNHLECTKAFKRWKKVGESLWTEEDWNYGVTYTSFLDEKVDSWAV